MNWLAPDSKFMRAWSNLVDGVWINILMLVTSIPLITIGAALTAGHDACRRSIEGEGKGVTANYFKSFKANFIKATLLWLPFLVVLIALVWSWIVLQITPLLIIKFALTILWLIVRGTAGGQLVPHARWTVPAGDPWLRHHADAPYPRYRACFQSISH